MKITLSGMRINEFEKEGLFMHVIADTHCHTVASTHAYSTLLENVAYAKKIGLAAVAITDHAPAMADGPHIWHFNNMRSLPQYIDGVLVLKGAEVNILNDEGEIDIPERVLGFLDLVIASMHDVCYTPSCSENHTKAWLKIAENPHVDIIGHIGSEAFKCDYEVAIAAFKKHNKVVEINSHSFTARAGSKENCKVVAEICKAYRLPVVVSSDAHFAMDVGNVQKSIDLLESVNFPEELVLNVEIDRFMKYASYLVEKKGRSL